MDNKNQNKTDANMNNLELYNKYKSVPKEALKEFNNGKFSGTDINTMWRIKCLTEEFGICGIGWYYDITRLWTEAGTNDAIMCFAEIKLFIKMDDKWSKGISVTGGSMIVQFYKSSGNKNNDEGYKMALTDALGVACKLLGFGADVYWANDKTKYTAPAPKPKVEYATTAQIKKITELVPNIAGVCAYCKVEKLTDIPKSYLEKLIENKQKEVDRNAKKI